MHFRKKKRQGLKAKLGLSEEKRKCLNKDVITIRSQTFSVICKRRNTSILNEKLAFCINVFTFLIKEQFWLHRYKIKRIQHKINTSPNAKVQILKEVYPFNIMVPIYSLKNISLKCI